MLGFPPSQSWCCSPDPTDAPPEGEFSGSASVEGEMDRTPDWSRAGSPTGPLAVDLTNEFPTTFPTSKPSTNNDEFLILIPFRSEPDWIRVHLSFKRMRSIIRCCGDKSGLIEMGLWSEPFLDSTLTTSARLESLTRIGRGLDAPRLYRPSRKLSQMEEEQILESNDDRCGAMIGYVAENRK